MILNDPQQKLWLCAQPVDMRKSFDGLSGVVTQKLQENAASGQYFIFFNRRKTQIKILYFDGSGFCIWTKRLEAGQFNFNTSGEPKLLLNWFELRMIIDGIDVKNIKKFKRYQHILAA